MTSRKAVRRQLYREVDGVGFNFTATGTLSGGGFVQTSDPRIVMGGSNVDATRYHGHWLYQAAQDEYRAAGDLSYSTGVATVAHEGAAWAATTETDHEMIAGVLTPVDLNEGFNDVLRALTNDNLIPLAHGPLDYDMQAVNDDAWDLGLSNASGNKDTDASDVYRAKRSHILTLSGAGGYMEADSFLNMAPGKSGTMFARARVVGAGGVARLIDGSSSTIESVNFSPREWVFAKKRFTLSASQTQIKPRMLGTDNGDVIHTQDFWIVKEDDYAFYLPSWVDERALIRGVYRGYFNVSGPDADTWLAGAMELERLEEGEHYRSYFFPGAANKRMVVIEAKYAHLLTEPLFVDVAQPWSSPWGVDATLINDASETECPVDLMLAKYKLMVLYGRYPDRFPELENVALPEKRAWTLRTNPQPESVKQIRRVF